MNDFDYENYQKKRLAHQAFHRKRGSKSKRCPMSTDYMTQKQWKERNGKVVSINLDKPTSWENFKELSKSLQEEYLRHLAETYNANATNLAEMFGLSVATVRRHIQSADLDIKFRVGHSMNAEQRDAWERFLHSAQDYIVVSGVSEEEKAALGEAMSEGSLEPAPTPMKMSKFSLCFIGPINVEMVANSLRRIVGDNASGEVRVVCSLTEGC